MSGGERRSLRHCFWLSARAPTARRGFTSPPCRRAAPAPILKPPRHFPQQRGRLTEQLVHGVRVGLAQGLLLPSSIRLKAARSRSCRSRVTSVLRYVPSARAAIARTSIDISRLSSSSGSDRIFAPGHKSRSPPRQGRGYNSYKLCVIYYRTKTSHCQVKVRFFSHPTLRRPEMALKVVAILQFRVTSGLCSIVGDRPSHRRIGTHRRPIRAGHYASEAEIPGGVQ